MITYNQIRYIHFQVDLDFLMWNQLLWKELKLFMLTSILLSCSCISYYCVFKFLGEKVPLPQLSLWNSSLPRSCLICSQLCCHSRCHFYQTLWTMKRKVCWYGTEVYDVFINLSSILSYLVYIYIFVLTYKLYWICGYLNVNKFS